MVQKEVQTYRLIATDINTDEILFDWHNVADFDRPQVYQSIEHEGHEWQILGVLDPIIRHEHQIHLSKIE